MESLRTGFEKVKEFATSNPLAFVSFSVWVVTLVLVYLRDRSWASTVRDLERALSAVEFDKNRLMEEVHNFKGEDIQELCKVAFELLQKSANESVEALAREIPKYFSSSTFLQIVFLLSCILFEFNLLYSGLSLKVAGKNVNSVLIIQTLNFLSKYHPITSLIFGVFVILRSGFAWIGILDRSTYVDEMLRWQLSFYLAGVLAYLINNLAGAKKYLPKDWNDWQESFKQSSWWIWLLSRASGLHNPNLAGVNLLWLGLKTFFAFGIRYFFYYRRQGCTFDDRNHVFFINTIVHIWIILLSALLFYLPIILLNLNRLQQESPATWFVALVRRTVFSWMQVINRWMSDQQTLGLYTFFLMATLAVYLFRFLYFLWTAKCTWYAWFVSWIFIHIHIALVLFALPGLNFLMQRLKMHKMVRTPFVEKFGEGLLQVNQSGQSASSEKAASAADDAAASPEGEPGPKMNTDEAKRLGETYYEETLLSAMLYGVFTDLSPLKQDREEKKKQETATEEKKTTEEEDLEDQELYLVFNLVLQSDLLAMEEEDAAAAEEQEAQEEASSKEAKPDVESSTFTNEMDGNSSSAEAPDSTLHNRRSQQHSEEVPEESVHYEHDKLD